MVIKKQWEEDIMYDKDAQLLGCNQKPGSQNNVDKCVSHKTENMMQA